VVKAVKNVGQGKVKEKGKRNCLYFFLGSFYFIHHEYYYLSLSS